MGVPIWLRTSDASGIARARKKPTAPVWLIAESSSGLGLALAKGVLRQGHRAILATRSKVTVQDLADAFPDTAFVVALNDTKPDDIARVVQKGRDRFGSIDILVNTAGAGYIPAVMDGDSEDIGRQVHINLSNLGAT
jgi:NAD(P)-dependent dehydrogenase (short-subunit alcohol dehydrogenase family)